MVSREADQLAVIAAMSAEQETLGHQRTATEEERTQARVALAQFREKQAALSDQVTAAERDLAGTRDGIEQAQADLDQSRTRIRESERAILRLQSEMAGLFMEKDAAETDIRRLADLRADQSAAIAALADQARVIESESDALQEDIHARELELRELQTKRDDLVQRVRDDLAIDLAAKHAEWKPEEVDWNAVAEEIRELQGKIERLGAVNLEAIQEQEALQQRADLLRQQRDDLVKAREALGGLIDRINRESRERFMKTFTAVREHFQELYRKLFGGGKADVFLENEEDVLESGIEVVARPPGKQLQRISLLSGGEKTMTAVALLLGDFPGPAQPVLHPGRGRRGPRRGERRPVHGPGARVPGTVAVRHHLAQQADDVHRRRDVRRDDAGAGRLAARQRQVQRPAGTGPGGRRVGPRRRPVRVAGIRRQRVVGPAGGAGAGGRGRAVRRRRKRSRSPRRRLPSQSRPRRAAARVAWPRCAVAWPCERK